MTLSEDGSDISCTVERPGGTSYLFFQLFEMQVSRGAIQEANVFVSYGQASLACRCFIRIIFLTHVLTVVNGLY